jgi:hypothetical protein
MHISLNKTDVENAERMLKGLKDGFPKVMARSLNKTTTQLKTAMIALIRSRYNYKAKTLRDRFKIQKATFTHQSASLKSSGYGVHLSDIVGARFLKKSRQGVKVNVKKATGIKRLPHAFIAKGHRSGKMIVFQRADSGGKMVKRLPIKAQYAPDPEVLYNSHRNWPDLAAKGKKILNKNFAHELDVVLKGIA